MTASYIPSAQYGYATPAYGYGAPASYGYAAPAYGYGTPAYGYDQQLQQPLQQTRDVAPVRRRRCGCC